MTIAFSIGKYGGFYFYSGYTKRVCLGWIAIMFIPAEIDDILYRLYSIEENDRDEHLKAIRREGAELIHYYYMNGITNDVISLIEDELDDYCIDYMLHSQNVIDKMKGWKE